MENSEKILVNGGYYIKVNKKKNSTNNHLNTLSNDSPRWKEIFQINNSNDKNLKNKINNSHYQNGLEKFISLNFHSSPSLKEFKYRKIHINNRYNNNEINSNNKTLYTINKKRKKLIDNENGKDFNLYKSETQYSLINKQKSNTFFKNSNKSTRSLNTICNSDTEILSNYDPNYEINLKNEIRNNIFDNKKEYEYNNAFIKTKSVGKPEEKCGNKAFNNLEYNFYKPLNKKINNNTNFDNNINKKIFFINNSKSYDNYLSENKFLFTMYHKPNYKKEIFSKLNKEYNDKIKKENINNNNINYDNINNNNNNNNNIYNFNKQKNNIIFQNDDKKLLSIYKEKLITIFVKLINNFYNKYTKKLFAEFIYNLTNFCYNKYNNRKYKKIEMKNEKKSNQIRKRRMHYYIKKTNLKLNNNINNNDNNINDDNLKKSFSKPLITSTNSTNNEYSFKIKYKKIIKNKNSKIENNNFKDIYLKNYNLTNVNSVRNSYNNIYIPVKNRNKKNYNYLSGQKGSIFDELKIKKNINTHENIPSFYKNKNSSINTEITRFYNTNRTINNITYINRINSYNSIVTLAKKGPKIINLKNNQLENSNELSDNNKTEKSKINLKYSLAKNKSKIFYKKILPKGKSKDENNKYEKDNIFIKRVEKLKNKNKSKDINHTYTKNISNNDNNLYKNYYSYSKSNLMNDNNKENNYNSNNNDISNEINNYCLEDIDKPTNIIYIKNNIFNNDINNDNKEDSLNNEQKSIDFEIKNIIQIITNDKRLFLNFNYIQINQYNKNKIKNNFFYISNVNSIDILGNNKKLEENIYNLNNEISFNDSPEKINIKLNKFAEKRKRKSAFLKLYNILNNKIYEYKCKFFEFLKKIKFKFIIIQIINNCFYDKIKKYFYIFKKNIKLEQTNFSFKNVCNKTNNKSFIFDKKNINLIMDISKNTSFNHLKNKDKLKFLVKQINLSNRNNNNNIYQKEFNKNSKTSNKSSISLNKTDINDFFFKTRDSNNSNEGKRYFAYLRKKVFQKELNNSNIDECSNDDIKSIL